MFVNKSEEEAIIAGFKPGSLGIYLARTLYLPNRNLRLLKLINFPPVRKYINLTNSGLNQLASVLKAVRTGNPDLTSLKFVRRGFIVSCKTGYFRLVLYLFKISNLSIV